MKYLHLIPAVLGTTAIALISSTFSANAASVSFSANDGTTSGVPVNVDIFAEDRAAGDGIDVTFTVNDPDNTGDLRAGFIDFVDSFDFENSITNVVNALSFEFNENNIGGNIGRTFDLGIELTSQGASGGLVTTQTVSILGTGLDVTDILGQQAAVRVQAVGPAPNGGGGSAKQFGTAGLIVDPNNPNEPVPEPMTILGTVVAAGMGGWLKRAKKKSAA